MNQTNQLLCTAEHDPTGKKRNSHFTDEQTFGINLSLSCWFSNYSVTDEQEAFKTYIDFFDLLSAADFKLNFQIYEQIDNFGLNKFDVHRRANAALTVEAPKTPNVAQNLLRWLTIRSGLSRHFWAESGAATDAVANDTVDLNRLRAMHLMRSVLGWNPPVPAQCRLTHLLRFPDMDVSKKYVALPFFDVDTYPPKLNVQKSGDDLIVEYEVDKKFGSVATVTRHLTVPTLPLPMLDYNTGFFNVLDNSVSFRQSLQQFEQGAATQLWSVAALQSAEIEELLQPRDRPQEWDLKESLFMSGPVWLACMTLVSVLDPIYGALLMSGLGEEGNESEGPIAGLLVPIMESTLDERIESLTAPASTVIGKFFADLNLLTEFRSLLSTSALLKTSPKPSMDEVSASLHRIFDLGDQVIWNTGQFENKDANPPTEDPLGPRIVPAVLAYLVKFADGDAINVKEHEGFIQDFGKDFYTTLHNELSEIITTAQSESGAEQIIIRLLNNIQRDKPFTKTLMDALNNSYDLFKESDPVYKGLTEEEKLRVDKVATTVLNESVTAGWTALVSVLETDFNGYESVLRASGFLFSHHLLAHADLKAQKSGVTINSVVDEADYYVNRLAVEQGKSTAVFSPVDHPLFRLEINKYIPKVARATELLARLYKSMAMAFIHGDADLKFRPDTTPQPLPLRVALSNDIGDLALFDDYYNGLGLAIKRIYKSEETKKTYWAHANLASLDYLTPKELDPNYDDKQTIFEAPKEPVLLPIRPTVNDGRVELYMNYEGLPFATSLFSGTLPPGSVAEPIEKTVFFYKTGLARFKTPPTEDFNRTPKLVYGNVYQYAAFAITNAGTGPDEIWEGGASDAAPKPYPGRLRPQFQIPEDNGTPPAFNYINTIDSSRTTAVGQVSLLETTDVFNDGDYTATFTPKATSRIGTAYPDVYPLSHDYPRLSLAATIEYPTYLDLGRRSTGAGSVGFELSQKPGKVEAISVLLTELHCNAVNLDDGELTVGIYSDAQSIAEEGGADASFDIDLQTVRKLRYLAVRFTLTREQSGDKPMQISVSLEGLENPPTPKTVDASSPISDDPADQHVAKRFWLRLQLRADQLVKESTTLSFSDPSMGDGRDKPGTNSASAPFLLIAPLKRDQIVDGVSERIEYLPELIRSWKGIVTFPQVGYQDFDRWISNESIRTNSGFTSGADLARLKQFQTVLLKGYAGRHSSEELAYYLDRLPDLSVSRLLIELIPLDSLCPDEEPGGLSQAAMLEPLKEWRLLEFIRDNDNIDNGFDLTVESIKNLLHNLLVSHSTNLEISCAPDLKLALTYPVNAINRHAQIIATVPSGMTALLRIRPLVASSLFEKNQENPPIFDARIKQLAVGKRGEYYVFEGTSLTIEALKGELRTPEIFESEHWRELLSNDQQRMIKLETSQSARHYNLSSRQFEPTNQMLHQDSIRLYWRRLASVETHTQRWRPSGRPIYTWINPGDYMWSEGAGWALQNSAAAELRFDKSGDDRGYQFEREAYFDRTDDDAESTEQRLDVITSPTTLLSVDWSEPSAMLFRHRFSMYSRYIGAMLFKRPGSQDSWTAKTADAWARRSVVLADRSRLQLTRPQLRALIPLTNTPDQADNTDFSRLPPIMAVLQERPFALAGLADRITATIKTGFGYGFPEVGAGEQVIPLDSRKEFGPDPRLTYAPADVESTLGITLMPEYPIGLTYDSPEAPAPRFVNTALSLQALSLNPGLSDVSSLEEYFAGVVMNRHLAVEWLHNDAEAFTAKTLARSVIELPFDQTWWIEIELPKLSDIAGGVTPVSTVLYNRIKLLSIDLDNNAFTVKFNPYFIDETARGRLSLPICKMADSRLTKLFLLHHPQNLGQAVLSVLAQPLLDDKSGNVDSTDSDTRVQGGFSNLPVMMASVNWSDPELKKFGTGSGKSSPDLTITNAKAEPTIASEPTFLSWTHTNRNFDQVLGIAKEKKGSSPEWQPNRWDVNELEPQLDAKVIENGRALTFNTRTPRVDPDNLSGAEFREKIWIRGSLWDSATPLHVHRHMAVILTKISKGLGRTFDVFLSARLLSRRRINIPAAIASELNKLQFMEFETPAAILTNCALSNIPKTYVQPYFDFVAVGLEKALHKNASEESESKPKIRFYIRFIQPVSHKVVLKLHVFGFELAKTVELSLDGTLKQFSSCEITLHTAEGARNRIQIDVVPVSVAGKELSTQGSTGFLALSEGPPPQQSPPPIDGIGLSIATTGVELWSDVSFLTVSTPVDSDADTDGANFNVPFDWFFSDASVENNEPSELVKPAGLTGMKEVQARVIALSQSIDIRD